MCHKFIRLAQILTVLIFVWPICNHSVYFITSIFLASSIFIFWAATVALWPFKVSNKRMRKIRVTGIRHYTPTTNASYFVTQGNVTKNINVYIKPSMQCGPNAGNTSLGKCLFLFQTELRQVFLTIKMLGKHRRNQLSYLHIHGQNVPPILYTRLWDRAILLPGGYKGLADWV